MNLQYDPLRFNAWQQKIVDCFTGSSNSIQTCSKKFEEQLLELPKVWSGGAASANYNNFYMAYDALKNFIDAFSLAYQNMTDELKNKLSTLETVNLSIGSFPSTNVIREKIGDIEKSNIQTDTINYGYDEISLIGEELKRILTNIQMVGSNLRSLFNEIGRGKETDGYIWNGNLAERTKAKFLSILDNNMPEIENTLDICIQNIKEAAANAKSMDV